MPAEHSSGPDGSASRSLVDLGTPLRVHVVGVGGAGMSAIATTLAAMGHDVSGSDLRDSSGLERLRAAGVTVTVGHDAANVDRTVDFVAVSTAIAPSNPEVATAGELGIDVLRRAEILAAIAARRDTIAVAGTHGKTTTSSMLVLVLIEAGLNPSFIVGGDLNEIGSGAAWDTGQFMVVEADESDGTFLELPRRCAVVTNVEPDHLEHYGSWENLRAAFESFVRDTPGPAVLCADDPEALAIADAVSADRPEPVVTYGTSPAATYQMVGLRSGRDGCSFTLVYNDPANAVTGTADATILGEVTLPVAGEHNARNAAAALVTGMQLGASFDDGAAAVARFAGVARRFEHRGSAAGIHLIDDYAHLPTEVSAAVGAARDGGWARVVCVFQPHRYSRTEALWDQFANSFAGADVVVVTDVYSSGESPRPGVSGQLVVDAVTAAHPQIPVHYLPGLNDVVDWLGENLRPGDLCLTLGAGDLTTVPTRLLPLLNQRAGGDLPNG